MNERLILSANAAPHVGGQGVNLLHMVECLSGLFDMSVFCRNGDPGVPAEHIPPARLSQLIGQVPVVRRLRDWQRMFDDVHFDREVSRRLAAAHVFQGTTGQCLDSLATARTKGCFTVLDVVTFHIRHFEEQLSRESARFGLRSIQHPGLTQRVLDEYQNADVLRVMSEPARRSFLERGFAPERVFVAPPPFDLTKFPQTDFRGSRFTVSFVGLIEPHKGFHYLVEAFRKLNRPDTELVLWGNTGSRPVSQYMREQMSACPSIQIRPVSVQHAGYQAVYGKSTVLVHPSLTDGFGYVVGEAMASGIPVITTPDTGASQWVTDGVNGYVVPTRDAHAIQDRLEYLMDRPALVREMGEAARQTMTRLTLENFRQCYRTAFAAAGKLIA